MALLSSLFNGTGTQSYWLLANMFSSFCLLHLLGRFIHEETQLFFVRIGPLRLFAELITTYTGLLLFFWAFNAQVLSLANHYRLAASCLSSAIDCLGLLLLVLHSQTGLALV